MHSSRKSRLVEVSMKTLSGNDGGSALNRHAAHGVRREYRREASLIPDGGTTFRGEPKAKFRNIDVSGPSKYHS